MLDIICLWVGRFLVYGCGILLVVALVGSCGYLLWDRLFQYWFIKIKHLFPHWQYTQKTVDELIERTKNASVGNWRSQVTITQKGRLVKFYCPTAHFFCRTEYILVKK